MSAPQIPSSSPSSHGSASLELATVPSLWPLAWFVAWGAGAGYGILACRACGVPGRGVLLLACGAALVVAGAAVLPPSRRAVRRLRFERDTWWLQVDAAWREARLEDAVEVLRAGWWLRWREVRGGRRRWAWVDARRTPRSGYRALCRALQQRSRAGVSGGG